MVEIGGSPAIWPSLDVAGPHRDAVVFDHPVGQDRRQQRVGLVEFGGAGEALQGRAEMRDLGRRPALGPLRRAARVLQRQQSCGGHSHCTRPGSSLRSITGALRPAILLSRAMKSRCSSPYSRPLAFRKRYLSPSTASRGSNRMISLSAVGPRLSHDAARVDQPVAVAKLVPVRRIDQQLVGDVLQQRRHLRDVLIRRADDVGHRASARCRFPARHRTRRRRTVASLGIMRQPSV